MKIDKLNEIIKDNIRTLIAEIGSNPSRLSKDAGMGHTTIRDILENKKDTKSPRYDTLVKIASAANVDIRRITVGPDFNNLNEQDAEIFHLLSQLKPDERSFLLTAVKAQVDSRNSRSE